MQLLSRAIGPIATNVQILADERSREAIAIDTAIPSLAWISAELAARGWTLKLIVSTHGHWDHIGDNAAVAQHTGARIAVHPLDRERLGHPQPLMAPFEIPPSVPAVELAEGGTIRFGALRLDVLHTPGHTEGSVCLIAPDDGILFSGDTLFPGGPGNTKFENADFGTIIESIDNRLFSRFGADTQVLPGHGAGTTIGRESPHLQEWIDRGW